jgi:5-methylcytosine-specific restriction endonuclease McrA
MTKGMARIVRARANARCEYCLLPEIAGLHDHEIDHIVAEKHSGPTELTNLALCLRVVQSIQGTESVWP